MNSSDDRTFFLEEKKVLDDFKKEERSYVIEDASELLLLFDKTYQNILEQQDKVNILITGTTGAGKSSLINSIFKQNLALTGAGVPITQKFYKYKSNNCPIVIYDSRGLEHGNSDLYIKSTKEFLDKHSLSTSDNGELIHIVWYVVNSANSRWHKFEENLCRNIFHNLPIMFILNKADLTTIKERELLRKCIMDMNLSNNSGIYDIVSIDGNVKNIEMCYSCKSDDIIIKKKIQTVQCMTCNYTESYLSYNLSNNGRETLVTDTYNILPQSIKVAFSSAQYTSIDLKKQISNNSIIKYWDEWKHINSSDEFMNIISNMMVHLSIVWNLRHAEQYGNFMANDIIKVFENNNIVQLLYHSDENKQRIHCISICILWNRCLYGLIKMLFDDWKSENKHICDEHVDIILNQLNGTNLEIIENGLQYNNICEVLNDA